MFTEFYQLEANAPANITKINARIAEIRSVVGKDAITTHPERDGEFLYIVVRYYAQTSVPFGSDKTNDK